MSSFRCSGLKRVFVGQTSVVGYLCVVVVICGWLFVARSIAVWSRAIWSRSLLRNFVVDIVTL